VGLRGAGTGRRQGLGPSRNSGRSLLGRLYGGENAAKNVQLVTVGLGTVIELPQATHQQARVARVQKAGHQQHTLKMLVEVRHLGRGWRRVGRVLVLG
jgi:hypothetical protein